MGMNLAHGLPPTSITKHISGGGQCVEGGENWIEGKGAEGKVHSHGESRSGEDRQYVVSECVNVHTKRNGGGKIGKKKRTGTAKSKKKVQKIRRKKGMIKEGQGTKLT
ncbi:hypothetical protein KIN20_018128 [Parelaphostrongylus tenuis]|uniref:Uncharacterized protein n=1 Tax=Parelaphostrongylus tenuis TaxID=148309 RepID=A0AAD5QRW7_PARTN|nr:hypothetical protein KIN20_018128 [Parelaphostrongylus tenuis]